MWRDEREDQRGTFRASPVPSVRLKPGAEKFLNFLKLGLDKQKEMCIIITVRYEHSGIV